MALRLTGGPARRVRPLPDRHRTWSRSNARDFACVRRAVTGLP
ncbi:hypothetical protein BIWAKO_00430 [Bosea sp. BIWAKO-01]|nr:hypothetical protein BIWAKO_00430 [Bosea sp. BIWAKO-01]